jgi:gamma-F420-2:alpha-L-glutamate ligase
VIRQLERLKVPVINSAESIERAKDKLHTVQVLAADNLPTPKTMLARFPVNIDVIEKEFECPLIVKTLSGSEGKGVFLCENREHLEKATGMNVPQQIYQYIRVRLGHFT